MVKKQKKKTTSDKFDELPWWAIPVIFVVIIIILELTTEIGVGYYFFALLGAGARVLFLVSGFQFLVSDLVYTGCKEIN